MEKNWFKLGNFCHISQYIDTIVMFDYGIPFICALFFLN